MPTSHLTRRGLMAAALAATLAVTGTIIGSAAGAGTDAEANRPIPETIDLPAGFAPEGVTMGAGDTYYAGSLADGRIARGSVRAGTTEVFVADPVVPIVAGLAADVRRRMLWTAGGPTGQAAVYHLVTGEPIATLQLGPAGSFINDVIVTDDAAYFTESFGPGIIKVPVAADGTIGTPEPLPLSGPAADGLPGFNLNGIEAIGSGRVLLTVNSGKGELYAVNARTGESTLIDLGRGVSIPTADGILLRGRTLMILQNGGRPGTTNQILVVRLNLKLGRGQVIDTITSPLFETATTLARTGNLLVAANAQFAGSPIDPDPELVVIPIR